MQNIKIQSEIRFNSIIKHEVLQAELRSCHGMSREPGSRITMITGWRSFEVLPCMPGQVFWPA